jgi:CheY-like chemotaxis protein
MSRKVLIVDDDEDIRGLLNLRLRSLDYDTVFAADGIGAISTARKEEPDLILLDIGLPGGDGFTVIERLKRMPALQPTPIIVVSARADAPTRERALAAGAKAFLEKPVDKERLFAEVERALEPAQPD